MVIDILLECVVVTVDDMKSILSKSKWISWHCHVKRNLCKHVLRSQSPRSAQGL